MYYSFSLFLSSYVFVSFLFMSHPITIFCVIYIFSSYLCFLRIYFYLLSFYYYFSLFSFNNLRFFSFYNTPIIYLIYLMDYSSLLVMRKIEAIKFACACMHACSLITGVGFVLFYFLIFLSLSIFSSSWSIFYSKPAYTK